MKSPSPRALPAKPSLEHLKAQAKDLLAAAKRGDADALARFPRASATLALHDAQSVLAREYGFPSWRALREHVLAQSDEANVKALYERHLTIPLPPEVLSAVLMGLVPISRGEGGQRALDIPSELPLLPLRNALLVPGAVAPLDIGRASTLAAIESSKEGLIGVFAQRDPSVNDPVETDLHPVGCVARITKSTPKPDGNGIWLVVHGVAWVTLDSFADGRATIAPFEIEEDSTKGIEELRTRLSTAAQKLPDPAPIRERIARMAPRELSDAAVANAVCSVEAKAEYACERRLSVRIGRALALLG
jgi:Lon protease-like protein